MLQTQVSMEQGGREVYDQRARPVNATGGVSLGPASAAQSAVERAAALGGPRMIRCELCQVRAHHPPAALCPACRKLHQSSNMHACRCIFARLHAHACAVCYDPFHLQHSVQVQQCGWQVLWLKSAPDCLFWASCSWPVIMQASFVGDPQYKQHLDSAIHRKAIAKEEARRQRELLLGANAGAAESAVVRTESLPLLIYSNCQNTIWNLGRHTSAEGISTSCLGARSAA